MQSFHNILYICRGIDDETDGLKQALSLAKNNQAALKILVIAPELPKSIGDYSEKYKAYLVEEIEKQISNTSKELNLENGNIKLSIALEMSKTPGTAIIKQVIREEYDLIVKESQTLNEKSGLKALDMELLRKCPCPVWLCRPISTPSAEMKIAVAIDPDSDETAEHSLSKRMIRLAHSMANKCNGKLQILSCWDFEYEDFLLNSPRIKADKTQVEKDVQHAEKSNLQALKEIIKAADIKDGKYEVFNIRGTASKKIPEFVNENKIDVLVMGTLARTGISGFIIGNTAENIVQRLPCSLMALKPKGFISPVKA